MLFYFLASSYTHLTRIVPSLFKLLLIYFIQKLKKLVIFIYVFLLLDGFIFVSIFLIVVLFLGATRIGAYSIVDEVYQSLQSSPFSPGIQSAAVSSSTKTLHILQSSEFPETLVTAVDSPGGVTQQFLPPAPSVDNASPSNPLLPFPNLVVVDSAWRRLVERLGFSQKPGLRSELSGYEYSFLCGNHYAGDPEIAVRLGAVSQGGARTARALAIELHHRPAASLVSCWPLLRELSERLFEPLPLPPGGQLAAVPPPPLVPSLEALLAWADGDPATSTCPFAGGFCARHVRQRLGAQFDLPDTAAQYLELFGHLRKLSSGAPVAAPLSASGSANPSAAPSPAPHK